MTETSHRGRCLCGALEFDALGPLENLCFCHCESCRRASGAPFVAWGTCTRDGFVITKGEAAFHHSSPPVTRGFCGRCGTTLTYAHQGRPDDLDVALATLDDPGAAEPQCHIWVADKLEWIEINDDLPQYAGWHSDG